MYVRDKRSPTPKNEAVSRVMSANRAKNSTPELTLRKALYKAGLRGYRLHRRVRISGSPPYAVAGNMRNTGTSSVPERGVDASRGRGGSLSSTRPSSLVPRHSSVRPDISYVGKKLAIFVHGCFWHRCPKCSYKLPKTNSAFWKEKFDHNVARDARKAEDLRNIGWTVLTVWECDLKEDLPGVVHSIQKALT